MAIEVCAICKIMLTASEIELYGDKCLDCARKHAKEFTKRIKELGEEEE
jgi:PHP family Zn ribbon phosphoesterase